MKPVIDWNYKDQTKHISFHADVTRFEQLPDAQKRAYACITGQIYYGFHRNIPDPCQYITMLRHPIDRLLSQYYYMAVRQKRLGETVSQMSIEEYVAYEPFQAYTQLNLIAGGETIEDALKRDLADDAIDIAMQNIERDFVTVGFMEQYDESLVLMKHALGWQRAFYSRSNINRQRKYFDDLPTATQRFLERVCAPEIEFYERAQAHFNAQIEQARAEGWFDRELTRLQRRNQHFQRLYKLAEPIRHTKVWFTMRKLIQRMSQ